MIDSLQQAKGRVHYQPNTPHEDAHNCHEYWLDYLSQDLRQIGEVRIGFTIQVIGRARRY